MWTVEEKDTTTVDGTKAKFKRYDDSAWPCPWVFEIEEKDFYYSCDGFFGNHYEDEHPLDLVPPAPEKIAGKTLEEWKEFSRRDDCLDRMVPSDLRALIAKIPC